MNFAPDKKRQRRLYENVALVAVRQERLVTLLWTRRGRKSTTLGNLAFDELSSKPGKTVIGASASLLTGAELVSMTVTATEQAMRVKREAEAMRSVYLVNAEEKQLDFKCADQETGKVYRGITEENFVDIYSSKRLEMRLYFDHTNYSRELIIAPNPATARGWGGTVFRDEAGFTHPNLETELQLAVNPIFRDDPTFKMIYASNLPRNDKHPFFEMTLPPPDAVFPAKPEGHFYRGQNKMLIHRVALCDAYAAGHVLYDNKGDPMTLEAFRSEPANKIELPHSYDLIHQMGGNAAVDLRALLTAQARGATSCGFFFVDSDSDFRAALKFLRANLGPGRVGLGFDPASTTGETSNPSSFTATEERGIERAQRVVVLWKEKRENVQKDRLRQLINTVASRSSGGPAVRLCIAAGNERLFSQGVQEDMAALIPVDLIIEGGSVKPLPPGYQEAINYKTWLGDIYSAAVNDNHYAMPCNDYFKQDQRLTVKNAGRYECDPEPDGKHGDTFVSGEMAEYALMPRAMAGPILVFENTRSSRIISSRADRSIAG
jgi:hypothetical protein